MAESFLIGIAGGTGAGKTTLARILYRAFGEGNASIIPLDAYYRDRSHLPPEERENVNYDHPDAFETQLLITHLKKLKNSKPIRMPIYDFKTHTRKDEDLSIEPTPIIILEGIMTLVNKQLRDLFDLRIFVDASSDIRILRRMDRDIKERERSFKSVVHQYLTTVRPMHLKYVEPSKKYADVIISGECYDSGDLNSLVNCVKARVGK